jgi:hypothetical protein
MGSVALYQPHRRGNPAGSPGRPSDGHRGVFRCPESTYTKNTDKEAVHGRAARTTSRRIGFMMFKVKSVRPDEKIKARVLNRLRKVPDEELIRWTDNIHTGLGLNIKEIRKSLTRGNKDQILACIEDIKVGAVSLLAAMHVMEERITRS